VRATTDVVDVALAELDGTLASLVSINVADPKTFIGLLIGGSVAFLFSSLAIRAVSRTAGTVVEEVRRQFREKPGIMDYTERPDHGAVIDICTRASLRELSTPALLAVLTPVIIGFGIGYLALGAFLAAAIVTGQLMANFLSNAGGAWDNAKKYIEDGNEGGKGSETHKAAVIGDTVGDPFKDTAGPALNPLIKVMNLVSLLVLPAMIELQHNNIRFVVAGAALVVVVGALVVSKRFGSGIEIGDRLSLGGVDLIVRDLDDGRILEIGVDLDPATAPSRRIPLFQTPAEIFRGLAGVVGRIRFRIWQIRERRRERHVNDVATLPSPSNGYDPVVEEKASGLGRTATPGVGGSDSERAGRE
jgi:hypothetical protein